MHVIGEIKFHDGFVARIGSARLDNRTNRHSVTNEKSEITADLSLKDFFIVYDIEYDVEDYKDNGTMFIEYGDINFGVVISRDHKTKAITSRMKFSKVNIGGQYNMHLWTIPDNGHTQILRKRVRHCSY